MSVDNPSFYLWVTYRLFHSYCHAILNASHLCQFTDEN